MNLREPFLSVVIPAYNAAGLIDRALDSLSAQSSDQFEVLIVDDGSEDDLDLVLLGHSVRHRLIRQANAGASAARNTGAALATGTHLAFLDSDDTVAPTWVERFIEVAAQGASAVFCGMEMVDAGSGARTFILPRPAGPAYSDLEGLFMPGAYAVRTGLFHSVDGFQPDLPYGEHHEMWMRLAPLVALERIPTGVIRDALVIKYHDRTPARVASYDHSRKVGAEFAILYGGDRLGLDRQLLADYHAVAGVASFRLGLFSDGRRHLVDAAKISGWAPRHVLRLLLSSVPFAARMFWQRRS